MLQCKATGCRKQFSAKLGTIFEDSPLGLDKWFAAIWCVANPQYRISGLELSRALQVSRKTGWFLLLRLRLAMQTSSFRQRFETIAAEETVVGVPR